MKRPRRHKFISAGVFFLVYSVLYAVSQGTEAPPVIESPGPIKASEASEATGERAGPTVFGPTSEPKEKEKVGWKIHLHLHFHDYTKVLERIHNSP